MREGEGREEGIRFSAGDSGIGEGGKVLSRVSVSRQAVVRG